MTQSHHIMGKITKAVGLKGWVKVQSYTEHAKSLIDYMPWMLKQAGQLQAYTVEQFSAHGNSWKVKLTSIDDRNQAEDLAGHDIYIAREHLPELSHEQHYFVDLVGAKVNDQTGHQLGVLHDFMDNPAHPLMVIQTSSGQQLIPFVVGPIVTKMSPEQIVVDWQE